MKYSRPGPTQHDLTKARDRMGGAVGPNAATQPLPGSAPSRELLKTGALTAEQEAIAVANRQRRQGTQIRKVKSALAGAAVANSLATAQKLAAQAAAIAAPDVPPPPAADATDSLLT